MNIKKRIVVIYDSGAITGGAAKVAIDTAIGLSNKGYKVTYLCGKGPIEPTLKNSVDKVICLNQSDILSEKSRVKAALQGIWNKKSYNELYSYLKTLDLDNTIVHIHGYSHVLSSSIIKACNDCSITPFITLHEYFSVCPNGGFFNFKKNAICKKSPMSLNCVLCNCDARNYQQKLYRVVRQLCQDKYIRYNNKIKFIYISDFSLSKMNNYLSSRNFYYVHNPVTNYKNTANTNSTINKDYYIFVGRISQEKGCDLFCEALKRLSLKGIVVGEGPLKEKLENDYDNVEFVGWKTKNEIQDFYLHAKALVFPTRWYETDGLVVQEALSAGVQCIVADECASKDYIVDGVNGYLFKSGDLQSLIETIKKKQIENVSFEPETNYINNLLKVYEGDEQ